MLTVLYLDKDDDFKNAVTATGASLGIVTTDGHIAALAKVRRQRHIF